MELMNGFVNFGFLDLEIVWKREKDKTIKKKYKIYIENCILIQRQTEKKKKSKQINFQGD